MWEPWGVFWTMSQSPTDLFFSVNADPLDLIKVRLEVHGAGSIQFDCKQNAVLQIAVVLLKGP